MPGLDDATKKPSNIGELIPPATPTAQNVPPIIPREQPGLSPTSLGPAPSLWTTGYDSVRQWARPGTSQGRFPTLPTKSNPQLNAAARSVATQVVASTPSTGGQPITLTAPAEIVVSGSPGFNIALAWATEAGGTIFAGPPAGAVGFDAAFTGFASASGGTGGTLTVVGGPTSTASEWALYISGAQGTSFTSSPSGWTALAGNGATGAALMKNITGAVNASQAFSGTGNAAGVLCYFAGSVPTVVQAPSSVGSGGLPTLSIPFLSNTVAGNAAIVWVHSPLISPSGGGPNPPQPMACTDSQGNVGILIGSAFSPSSPTSGTGMQVSVFLIPNLKGAAETITVIVPGFPANTQVGTMQIYEITPPPPLAARPRFRPVTVLDLLTGTTGSGLIALSSSPTISNPLIAGTITSYNGTATVGAGIPSIVAQVNNTTASANIGTTTLFSPQAAGLYRVSYSVIVKTVGGTSTLPNLTFVWTDADNATSQSASFAAGTPTANTLTTLFTGTQIMSVRSGTLIQYKTGDVTAYASTGAAMVYSVRIRLEAL